MPKNLNSVDSRIARKRRRGESDEAYAQRIRRLDAKRESRLKRKSAALAEPTPQAASDHTVPQQILQRFLDEQSREREETASQVALLVKKLEQSEFERRRLEAELMRAVSSLSTRNLVSEHPVSSSPGESSHPIEIIDLSQDTSQNAPKHEIIEDFGDMDEGLFDGVHIEPKPSKTQDVFPISHLQAGDPAFITPSGYKGRAGRPVDVSPSEERRRNESDPTAEQKKFLTTLADVAEMLLWVGWVDRARQEHPHRLLVARFGELERRAWSDVVAIAAEFVGCESVDVEAHEIPFAFELTWTLRYALDALPAGAPISEVAARCATSFMKPHPRNRLGVLADCENATQVRVKFDAVLAEIEAQRLVIDRSAP